MKWFVFLSLFCLAQLAFKKAIGGRPDHWFDPRTIAVGFGSNAVVYSAFTWGATVLWSAEDNWLGRMAWYFRGLAWIDQAQVGIFLAAVVLVLVAAMALASRPGVYAQTVATVLENLAIFIFAAVVIAITLQVVGLTGFAVRSVWFDGHEWAPRISPLLLKFISVVWGAGVLIGLIVSIALALAVAYEAIRPFLFLIGLIRPYARGEDLVYENFALDLEKVASGPQPETARKILLFSDLHLTRADLAPIRSTRKSQESQTFIASVAQNTQPDLIVVSGDVTDVGDPSAWKAVAELLAPWKEKVFAVLGNHDIHFNRSFAPSVLAPMSVEHDILHKHLRSIDAGAAEWFPKVKRFPNLSLVVIGLDSNRRPPSTPLTNAIGEVGAKQLEVARARINEVRREGDLVMVVLHHQIISPKLSWDALYLRCMDAPQVLAFATDIGAGAIVHGHKHMPYLASSRNKPLPLIISCGSTHHWPEGPLAHEAMQPSAYEMTISDGAILAVRIIRDDSVEPILRTGPVA